MIMLTLRTKTGETSSLAIKRARFSGKQLILDEDDRLFLTHMDGKWLTSPEVRRKTGLHHCEEIAFS